MSARTDKYPTFSLITITLNNASGLRKTTKSIEKQTLKDFEWLVIDGESTDESLDFLREIQRDANKHNKKFRYTTEPDDGIYDAMNKGMQQARGKYMIFLNAGDELAAPDTLEMLAPHTLKKPDFIYGDAIEPSENGGKAVTKPARRYKDSPWGMITHHQAMIYSRLRLRDLKIHYSLNYKIASDYDFTLRFLNNAKKLIYIPKPICIFEQGGISQQQAALGRKEQYIIRESLDIVPQTKNLWIMIVQTLSWHLKAKAPWLYHALKPKIKKRKT